MKQNIRFFSIIFVWACWGALALYFNKSNFDETLLHIKEGKIVDAHCVQSRSADGVKFRGVYSDQKVSNAMDDYISLPPDIVCNEDLLKLFVDQKFKLTTYKNYYFGFEVGGKTIRSVAKSIARFKDKSETVNFTLFIAIMLTLVLLKIGRSTKK